MIARVYVVVCLLLGCTRSDGPRFSGLGAALLADQHVPGGAIAVVQDGVVVDEAVLGSANVQLAVPVQRTTLFQLASVTKIFSVIALFALEADGKLRLEDPVSKYLDGLPPAWQAVTLWQLASHTSGLPDVIASSNKPLDDVELSRTMDEALAFAQSRPIVAPPAAQFVYDQTNYVLIERVIARVSGTTFREFVTSRVLTGMSHTRWADGRALVSGRADMYTAMHAGRIENGTNLFSYPDYLEAAAGLNSSLEDMERFAVALTTGRALPAAELDRMWRPAVDREGAPFDLARDMKLAGVFSPTAGWFYADNSKGAYPRVFMTGGSATSFMVFPKQRLAVIVLTNLQASDDPLAIAERAAKPYLHDMQPMF